MVAFDTLNHTFQHSWKDISLASWRKYPHPSRPDVESIDLLKRDYDPETGILKTTRLLTMKVNIPGWLERITGGPRAYFIEEAVIDPRNNTMTLTAKNASLDHLMIMQETCRYTPHPLNRKWTDFTQEAKITAFPYGVSRRIEDLAVQTFRQNASKGRELMEQAIKKIKQEAEEGLVAVEEISSRFKHEAGESFDAVVKSVNFSKDKQRDLS